MSDWDFLHEMHEQGYSPEDIADAMATGLAPWDWKYVDIDWIDSELESVPKTSFQSREGFPYSTLEHAEVFYDLVECARRHFDNSGRYLQIWGELGEIYAEIKYGLRRHSTRTAGSDGTIAGKLVEVKTISPEKANNEVLVKSQGNFEQLLIVSIDSQFQFKAKLFDRSELKGGAGKYLKGSLIDNDNNT